MGSNLVILVSVIAVLTLLLQMLRVCSAGGDVHVAWFVKLWISCWLGVNLLNLLKTCRPNKDWPFKQ